jgi:hypothetical protein
MTIGALAPGPLAAIPAEFSGHAAAVGCPRCRAVLMLLFDEDGRGTEPLEVHGYDLAGPGDDGDWELKGGWMLGRRHECAG